MDNPRFADDENIPLVYDKIVTMIMMITIHHIQSLHNIININLTVKTKSKTR